MRQDHNPNQSLRSAFPAPSLRAALVAVVLLSWPSLSPAQFLRLGPFSFDVDLKAGAVYSSNIDGVRPTEEQPVEDDYYVFGGLDLNATAPASPRTTLTLSSGITVEKHFKREDLDNSTEPFGEFRLNSSTTVGYLNLDAIVSYLRASQSASDTFVPGGKSKTRNPNSTFEYKVGANWERRRARFDVGYGQRRTRYDKVEFQEGDTDDTSFEWGAGYQILQPVVLGFRQDRRKTENPRDPEDAPTWDQTDTASLNWSIYDKPHITYTLGYEREKKGGVQGDWEPTHGLAISDDWELNPRLRASAGASYKYEDNPEEDDVAFTYSGTLEHELTSHISHKLSANRQPRATFGSTAETDSTALDYALRISDILLTDLDLRFGVNYLIDRPAEGGQETTLSYSAEAAHVRNISSRLRRFVGYTYSWEKSSEQAEVLEIHEITWRYEYQL